MREKRRLGIVVAVALAVGASGVSGPVFPRGVEEILGHAVVLREAFALSFPGIGLGALLGVHDWNGDGWPDLVVASDRRVQVWFGDGQGGFNPGPWLYLEVEEYVEGKRIPYRPVSDSPEVPWQPYELEEREGKLFVPIEVIVHTGALVDLDGDGILDLVVRGYGGPREDRGLRLYLLRGLGGGEFARAGSVPHPQGLYISELRAADGGVLFTAAEEDSPTRLYRLSAPEGLASPRLVQLAEGPWGLRWAGDLTGDGLYDLVVSTGEMVQVLVGSGGGEFQEGPQFTSRVGEVQGVEVADLDGDSFLDLVVLTPSGIVTALRREDGYTESFFRDPGFPLWQHAVADLTGDGIPDLLVQRSTGFSEYLLLPGDGQGGFLEPVISLVVPDGILTKPYFVDLNADGLLDVVFAPFVGRRVRVYLNGGTPSGTSLHPLPGTLLAVGDFSGNGHPDILTADTSQRGVGVWWNDGRGGLVYQPLASLGRVPTAGALTPGVAYILLLPEEKAPAELVAIAATGEILDRWRLSEESLPVVVATDLNGDGLMDVAIPAKGKLLVLWSGRNLGTYPWPAGEVSFLAPGDGGLWAVSIGEYADLVEIRSPGRELVISDPLLQLEALPLTMTVGDLDGDGIPDPVVLAAELGVRVEEDEEVALFIERVVAGLVLSSSGPVVEEVPGFPEDQTPWPFLGAGVGVFGGVPHLIYTTSAGGGVVLVPWQGGWGEPTRFDVAAGPVLVGDLDGNGEPEVIAATVGLAPLLGVIWNGGGR
ncbi:MAG: hypothetical protein Kow0097_13600 [Candidatus Bipolaricaulota bacterium]